MRFVVLLLFVTILSSCSYDVILVSGKYTVSDITSLHKLGEFPKDTLEFKLNRTVNLITRDTTIRFGKWRIRDGEPYILSYDTRIPFSIFCKSRGIALLFKNCIYEKAYINRTGVQEPIK